MDFAQEIENWQRSLSSFDFQPRIDKDSVSIRTDTTAGSDDLPAGDIRNSFRPLAILAKLFGLFPCYDVSFQNLASRVATTVTPFVRFLDYFYSLSLFAFLTGGTVYCTLYQPLTLGLSNPNTEDTDRIVVFTSFYTTMVMGVLSLTIFPRKYSLLMRYIEHFSGMDRVLGFYSAESGIRAARMERRFSRIATVILIVITGLLTFMFVCLYILELPERGKITTDYVLVPLVTLAAMVTIVPNGLLVFFLNAIRHRLKFFNRKMKALLRPLTPTTANCRSFVEYGVEVLTDKGDRVCIRRRDRDLSADLEKMRILHEELTEVVKLTSRVFGAHLLRDFLSCILSIILFTYFTLFLRHEDMVYWYAYPIMDLAVVMKLIIVSTYGDFIKTEGSGSLRHLHKASLLRSSPRFSLQVQVFIQKLNEPLCISACGYFNIDRKVLTSIVGSTFMLFIILVQFKVTGRGYLL